MNSIERETTGLTGLDEILDGLRCGDNIVWRVDNIDDYRFFVTPFVEKALEQEKKVIYMRFAQHSPLLEVNDRVITYHLDISLGFESFATKVHNILTEEGNGAYYVFDCLSDLLSAWATDLMAANFFQVTCPYLYELDTIAYFALLRGRHSYKTTARIRETTQILLDLHNYRGHLHLHPMKVDQRSSPTMFLPHIMKEGRFTPLANSFDATDLLSKFHCHDINNATRRLDYWDRLFLEADALSSRAATSPEQERMIDKLSKIMIGRDERILSLARQYFSLDDLLEIKSRLIGTGFVGGKAVGMLLAKSILLKDSSFDWHNHLESHDSFFLGSDVYYSYMVHNGWWKLLMRQKSREGYFKIAEELREKMRQGSFPEEIKEELRKMLEYYGQYPIIVRSSSLLEDGFGNAFAGKYDSFFLVNQGSPEERYEQLENAVREIFCSAMSEDALAYRLQRGLEKHEEQMALLIQRVSGAYYGHYYFPELAGVGMSHNTFVWDKEMDPKSGMLR